MATGTILDEIARTKRGEVESARERLPLEDLRRRVLGSMDAPRDFAGALRRGPGDRARLIAEVKRGSPSAGVIREDFDPVAIARIYEGAGASCLSVLTDERYFGGRLEYLTSVRRAVRLPVLRKDFVIDPYQVWEARAAGADAVLLIAEILDDDELGELRGLIEDLGMTALVEFHDEGNLERVLRCGARVVGINNRDLKRFETDPGLTLRLRDRIPADITLVSESGIKTRADVAALEEAGVSAILVGEALMRAPDIGAATRALLGLGD